MQGTRLIYYNTDSDILLLSIPGAIPDHFQAYHLGFDAAIDAVPTSAVVIHHPDGSPKSISYVNSRYSCPVPHMLPGGCNVQALVVVSQPLLCSPVMIWLYILSPDFEAIAMLS